jgi:hypothetical protein
MPYNQACEDTGGDRGQDVIRAFVHDLEEARRPRVITLAELQEMPDLAPLYAEYGKGHIAGPTLAMYAKSGIITTAMRMAYGQTMRYWAGSCPTPEQMAQTPWEALE